MDSGAAPGASGASERRSPDATEVQLSCCGSWRGARNSGRRRPLQSRQRRARTRRRFGSPGPLRGGDADEDGARSEQESPGEGLAKECSSEGDGDDGDEVCGQGGTGGAIVSDQLIREHVTQSRCTGTCSPMSRSGLVVALDAAYRGGLEPLADFSRTPGV